MQIAPFKYRAFLSYSHQDVRWAKWLHTRLEEFRFDKELISRPTPLGIVPRTLRPIFRDREDFSGGNTLTDATVAALDASAALIVLCSRVAAGRSAVNEEVRAFRSRHPERPVVPVIVDGTWPDSFPPALRFELAEDGTVTDRPITVLGPDLRKSADGKNLGLAKLVAGLTGLGVDDIFRRAERSRRRRTRVWGAIAGFCLLLALLAGGSAIYAWQQLKNNEALLDATLKTATDIVNTAAGQARKYNVPRAATLELLGQAESLFDSMARFGRATSKMQYRKAEMLIVFARNYAALGDTGKERTDAEEAYHLLAALSASKPDDTTYEHDLSIAYEEVGDVLEERGDLPAALASYQTDLAIAKRLVQSNGNNTDWQHGLSISYARIGDVQLEQGDLPAALASYQAALTIIEHLFQSDAHNADWQRDLAISYSKIGTVQEALGHFADALTSFRADKAIMESLVRWDPDNASWRLDLSAAHANIGNVLKDQGNVLQALSAYQASLIIMERLAHSDPANAGWQHDLGGAHSLVGDAQKDRGNLPEALAAYRACLTIMERLTQSDPANANWQRDLSVAYDKAGDVQVRQDRLPAALGSYQASLAIKQHLTRSDPSNAGWEHALAISYANIGRTYLALKQEAEAREAFAAGRAIMMQLTIQHPNWTQWEDELVWFDQKIAGLQQ